MAFNMKIPTTPIIYDAHYTLDEYEKKQGWGHSCYLDTVQSALDANAKVLFLFHHDPAHGDKFMAEIQQDVEAMIRMNKSKLKCYLAREGLCVHLRRNSRKR